MSGLVPSLCVLLVLGAPPVETEFAQVFPAPRVAGLADRSPGQTRAVILLHGLRAHPFKETNVAKPGFQDWQEPRSTLVKTLADVADVYAFAYGQNAAIDSIVQVPALRTSINRLRQIGYREIILVGHSAGGLVARQFVEDFPLAGVTKVIQVCCPNGGSSWGKVKIGVRAAQVAFLDSLTKENREQCLKDRNGKKIPEHVEFVCVVGNGGAVGDGVVLSRCQWTEDLQKQGIPAVAVSTNHFLIMRSKEGAQAIAALVREKQIRWDPDRIATTRKHLLGDMP